MAVPEQTPYKEYTANGSTTSFALGFICDSKNDLIVLVDGVEPPVATWSLIGGNAVFTTAPASGKKIVLQRNTAMSRTTNYQGNNNSFRPETINKDIDRVWLKLQELGVADMLLKIYVDRLHGEQKDYIDNKDQLVRNIISDLRNYVNQQDNGLANSINNLHSYVDQQDNNRNSYFENLISRQGVSLQQLDSYYKHLLQGMANIAADKGWLASLVTDASGKSQQEINDVSIQNVASIAALRNIRPRNNTQVINVSSHREGFNLGGGLFKWDAANTLTDNNFNVIKATSIETGRFVRVQSSKLASIEDAGGLSGEDCSVAVQSLHDAGITVITGEVGATYYLKNININHKLKFLGDYKISKQELTDNMLSLAVARYDLVFEGIELDGAYLGDLSVGNPEIVISEEVQRGLVVRFKEVEFSNISKAVIDTRYNQQGLIQSVQVKDCTSNGQHRVRAFSEQSCLFSVHNAALLSIDGFYEVGTNEFESSGSEAADVTSMSMPLCISTNTQFVGKNIYLYDGGGIVQYSGCHNSTLTDSIIDNCAYGWRVQNSRNAKIKGGAITRTKIRGAILYQPYARLNTSTASLKEDNVSGLTVESVTLKDNNGDFVISGAMVYASELVKDPKVKLVKLINVISDGCTAEWMNVQDGDLISISGAIVTNCQGNRFIRFHQTALNGAGLIEIDNSEFDAGDRNMSLIGDPNNTITVKQPQTKVIVRDNVKLKNFQNSTSPVLYYKFIGELRFEDSEFIGANPPAVPYQANNCDLVVFKNIKGLNYPATINNGNNVNINLTNNISVISDHLKLASDIASEYVMTGTTAPTQTQMPIGSIARLASPTSGQAPYYIFTASGWKEMPNIAT